MMPQRPEDDRMIDEWEHLNDIVMNDLQPLCRKKGYDEGRLLLDFFEKYSMLNTQYNIGKGRYLSGDVVGSSVSKENATKAAEYVKNKYFGDSLRAKLDADIY